MSTQHKTSLFFASLVIAVTACGSKGSLQPEQSVQTASTTAPSSVTATFRTSSTSSSQPTTTVRQITEADWAFVSESTEVLDIACQGEPYGLGYTSTYTVYGGGPPEDREYLYSCDGRYGRIYVAFFLPELPRPGFPGRIVACGSNFLIADKPDLPTLPNSLNSSLVISQLSEAGFDSSPSCSYNP